MISHFVTDSERIKECKLKFSDIYLSIRRPTTTTYRITSQEVKAIYGQVRINSSL